MTLIDLRGHPFSLKAAEVLKAVEIRKKSLGRRKKKKKKKRKKRDIQNCKAAAMVSREHKRDAFHDKLQILRSITHSHAMNETSIVVDASNYIKELKHKVEMLNEEVATAESSIRQNMWPRVSVETLEKGVLVNVHSGRSCPGLLVLILATFEELGLNVLEARVSCEDSFHLQALGGENEEDEESVDAQMVKRTISNTIKNWKQSMSS